MNFKLKLFLITAFAACVFILLPAWGISAEYESVPGEKTSVSLGNEEAGVVSGTEKNMKKHMDTHQRKELLNKIESCITANNRSYRLIYMGIFFAVLIFAFLTLRVKEAKTDFKTPQKNI